MAKGKHTLLDVVAGSALGLLWFPLVQYWGGGHSFRLGLQLCCFGYYLALGCACVASRRAARFVGFVGPVARSDCLLWHWLLWPMTHRSRPVYHRSNQLLRPTPQGSGTL